ncbi:dual specificity protein phosphatase 1B [Selaginella moellendorffii]|uniref:dual specificity protein phosphatase 1B n=1 Tax=Selaginella moellendorffii TaxID=88036 RepID=UPI000D1C69F2|nr:dual specificity protein phosphatase 1B [Selaginella moellendorffii]|eukprot:XP_002974333.2 dual specificity protein phosphatase 1B [Selaginella moellendorffii]
MIKIREGLWLGNIWDIESLNQTRIAQHGITHILSMVEVGGFDSTKFGIVRKEVAIDDVESENLLIHLEDCLEFIDNAIVVCKGVVLVHCRMGLSRSVSVIVAHLMRSEGLSFAKGLAEVEKMSSVQAPREIYEELRGIDGVIRERGYVPDIKAVLHRRLRLG